MNLRATLLAVALLCTGSAAASAQQWDPNATSGSRVPVASPSPAPYVHPATPLSQGVTEEGYWVIVGSVPTHDMAAWERAGRAVKAKAAACGIDPLDDMSDHFAGFRPGYNVFLVGPYDRGKALAVRDVARGCIPDAYVKFGSYIGPMS
jgi:hypothetical protein